MYKRERIHAVRRMSEEVEGVGCTPDSYVKVRSQKRLRHGASFPDRLILCWIAVFPYCRRSMKCPVSVRLLSPVGQQSLEFFVQDLKTSRILKACHTLNL